MKRPPGTKFCCGVPHPQEQCDDCPMRAWDKFFQAQFVGKPGDGVWMMFYVKPEDITALTGQTFEEVKGIYERVAKLDG